MKLLKQVKLYFKEGNSDKVYEIDLCEAGNNLYVVNFRYGRRGAALKEGTKTEHPASLQKAETIFNELEEEKRAKGYRANGETSSAALTAPAVETIQNIMPVGNIDNLPPGREKAILKRLQLALEGKGITARFKWKTSRVIWAAGADKIEAAAPFIIRLAEKGDLMQQYAAVWSLGRIANPAAAGLLRVYFKNASSDNLSRIAGEALLHVLRDDELQKHIQYFINSLPVPVQQAINAADQQELKELLQERVINQQQPQYYLLENLYTISVANVWIKPILSEILLSLSLKPNYFRHIRHIYKMAELRDDFEMLGVLSCKFEREDEMFVSVTDSYNEDKEVYVELLDEYIDPAKELKKKSSRIAYGSKTRKYLRNRTMRNLKLYGKHGNTDYVRMATGILLAYDHDRDYTASYSASNYVYVNGRYQDRPIQHPANEQAFFMHQILSGGAANKLLASGDLATLVDRKRNDKNSAGRTNVSYQSNQPVAGGGLFKKIVSFFSGKKNEPTPSLPEIKSALKTVDKHTVRRQPDTPFIELWDKLPQAYVQLLINARMEEIHRFALTNLQTHNEYTVIKDRLDAAAIERLLMSSFEIPAGFGYQLALEKYNPAAPDIMMVKALCYSRLPEARETAKQWVNEQPDIFMRNSEWVAAILFCPHSEMRQWVAGKMKNYNYASAEAELFCGRIIAAAMSAKNNDDVTNASIEEAGTLMIDLFPAQMTAIHVSVAEDLIKSKVSATQVLGLKILLLKKGKINYDTLSNTIFRALLNNNSQAVREKGIELLNELSTEELLKRQELIIHCCISAHHDIRVNIRPVLKRMTDQDSAFGTGVVNYLAPYLMRKETSEGLQKDVSDTLRNELIGFVNNADKEMVLRLVYSKYVPAQEFGIAILEKYIDPAGFTMRQIIAFGNHETLTVRQWCWQYFSKNLARVKFERDESIRLLDAKWDDTREFAKTFFIEHFSENDWTPEALVGIADSVRPDIEAYGRELITRFFNEKDGEAYLLKLSQHPGEKMQLFATNYLERFASGNAEKIAGLSFYFRSVLSGVNKARVAKNRIFRFLLKEGKQSEAAAVTVAGIITNISATVSIEDKAKCIEILYELGKLYNLQTPLILQAVEERD